MELKPGYKLTEVGVIPEDWEISLFNAIGNVIDGDRGVNYPSSKDFNSDGYCLFLNAGNVTKLGFKFDDCAFITREKDELLNKGKLRHHDIVLTTRGTVGNFAYFDPQIPYKQMRINSGMVILRNQSPSIDTKFLYALLKSRYTEIQIDRLMFGSAQPQLTVKGINKLVIIVPPLPEQRLIATALSDVDALLVGLDQLIVKKRDLKQAAMQQLFTGKKRLPGVRGEWEVKRLGNHLEFLKNGVNSRAELTTDDPVKYLHYGDVHGSSSVFLCPLGLPSLPLNKAQGLTRLRDGDLVFADASEDLEGVGKSVEIFDAINTEIVAGLHTVAIRFDKSILADGFKAYMQFHPRFYGQLRRLAAGTKVYATNRSHIASIEMCLPSAEEQTAIATVLSDIDAEIAALEQRRDKTCALKQGMMQELLTGRTRLV